MDYFNREELLVRLAQFKGFKKDIDIADYLGLSKTNFSNKKKRDTLLINIVEKAIEEDIDLNWLIKGKKLSDNFQNKHKSNHDETDDLIDMAIFVLKANHEKHTQALKCNIIAFYDAVTKDIPGYLKKIIGDPAGHPDRNRSHHRPQSAAPETCPDHLLLHGTAPWNVRTLQYRLDRRRFRRQHHHNLLSQKDGAESPDDSTA